MREVLVIMLCAAALASGSPVSMGTAGEKASSILPNGWALDPGEAIAEGGTILGYAFQLEPCGYVITSADTGIEPVLAYSFQDPLLSADGSSPMLELAERDLAARMQALEFTPAVTRTGNELAWARRDDPTPEQWPPDGSTPTGGWLEENWTQNAPYNQFCPMDLIAGSRSLAGCPAVAMGAILNFHRETNGTRFDDGDDYYHNYHEYYWIDDAAAERDFPAWPELNTLLDTLESHYSQGILTQSDRGAVVYASGAACKQVYTASVSGTFGVNQAYDAYLRFGFDSCELLGEEADSLQERMAWNMMNALPAHLAIIDEGPQYGHNVVMDGYNTDGYFHLNFGWGGSSNGWYSFPLTGMPYGMNIIEGIVLDIGLPAQSAEDPDGCESLSVAVSSNPAGAWLEARISGAEEAVVTAIDGRVMGRVEVPASGVLSIPAGDWPAGVYILTATSGTATTSSMFTVLR